MRVEAINLDKYFGKTHAVRNLSFAIEPGRVTGFLGPMAQASHQQCV